MMTRGVNPRKGPGCVSGFIFPINGFLNWWQWSKKTQFELGACMITIVITLANKNMMWCKAGKENTFLISFLINYST